MSDKPEKNKRPRASFAIHTHLSKKRFERLQKQEDKWFKNYSDHFLISLDKTALAKRFSLILSFVSDFSTTLNVRFCDDVEMEKSNLDFRNKHEPTDVLSFPASPFEWREPEAVERGEVSLGDILICVPVCEWQARDAKHSLSSELEKMIIHGVVHLKGFDHERGDNAWRVMSGLEELIEKEVRLSFGEPTWCQVEGGAAAPLTKRNKEKA